MGDARDVGGPLSRPELDALVTTLQPQGIMHASLPESVGGTNRTFLERILLGAWAIGIMQAAIDDAVAFERERRTFGKPIAAHQMIQDLIAQMHVDLETSRLLTCKAAWLMDQGRRCDPEQSTAKLHACEVVKRVTDSAIQILGGRGLTTDEGFRTERLHRDARFLAVAEGTSQIMKLIIGRRLL